MTFVTFDIVGAVVGKRVIFIPVGAMDGIAEGDCVRLTPVGACVKLVGVGALVSPPIVGKPVGAWVKLAVVGAAVAIVGESVGSWVMLTPCGKSVGTVVGRDVVGSADRDNVGGVVGKLVGRLVGV